ncbi:hypothetical protein [Mycolicibacterium fluoranthenivorans]|uniref:Uncharacterized protein n=1 Tax=Mycolicibacterium fluoranthenivorans TaxID=258505 RepID=A0A1G4X4D5_9MYCO|nr:hypothetical protein [Mycolicibacterium fluoranthenivorans]SCX34500.1 hypothetical protein SAMN02799620_06357 [Mycolicibacterium fluoranthenivorans]
MIVLGFIVQCEICPQQAVVDTQPSEGGWVCPRCTEVTGPSPDPFFEKMLADAPKSPPFVVRDDDEYPIGKVRG